MIYAEAQLGHPVRVETVRQFRRHFRQHKMSLTTDQLPYKKCYFLPILSLRKMKISFVHPRGAISIVRYFPHP